ncbi:MAG: hypothetical protein H6734_24895, partial [Alphaproteobacteria bacterium]|nr:hypothetical protein [Alphaproteobacteria bacterium]
MTLLLTLLAGCAVCGPSFSDTCAVEDGACSEPEPSACARASGISLGISHAAVDAALVSTSCQPYYVA